MPESLVLTLVRGLPGSGKSTLLERWYAAHDVDMFAADDFFLDEEGVYNFDPTLLGEAHAQCQSRTRAALENGSSTVVTNTFSQRWELEPYLALAKELEVTVFVIDLFDSGCTDEELFERNVHGVPLEGIRAMRSRWEHDWKDGDPLPPWERQFLRPIEDEEVSDGG
jgi:predicted kinase